MDMDFPFLEEAEQGTDEQDGYEDPPMGEVPEEHSAEQVEHDKLLSWVKTKKPAPDSAS